MPVRTVDTFCLKTRIITFDDRTDSVETINQIRKQNAVRRAQCAS